MPFTPYHMGPGLLFKAVLRGSFSLMVFGWSQVLMDLQPLVVLAANRGHLHGFSHTYLAALLIAPLAALTGKYPADLVLGALPRGSRIRVPWGVALATAFIGTFSHVALDSVIYTDIRPLAPFSQGNGLLGLASMSAVYDVCLYSGIAGAVLCVVVGLMQLRRRWR